MRGDDQITFGEFRLDELNECLWRENQAISLRPKVFAVLKYLIEHKGQLITKKEFVEKVWPDAFVTDAVLKDSIRQLRAALEDDVKSPRYIETAHRRGYRFIGQISKDQTPDSFPQNLAEGYSASSTSGFDNYRFNTEPWAAEMVGRESELSQMRGWLEKMLGGERQIVFVTGEPGIGKTTLVEAFIREALSERNIRIGRGQCLEQYGEGEAYLPVLEVISRFGRGPDHQRFVKLLLKHAPTWLAQIPSLISPAERDAILQRQVPGGTRERMLREMAETLETQAAETPLILLLEDLHWSDYSTLDLISYLARRREIARLMLIGTYRPTEVILGDHPLHGIKRELQAHRLCKELPLGYLTEEAVAEYLTGIFPEQQFATKLATEIHHRTEGNPLFMVNAVDYLLDRGIIVEQQGHWHLQVEPNLVELGVPETIRNLIEKQIERLDDDERWILEGASIVGMDCSAVAISAGLDEDIVKIEEVCDKLVRRHQFLFPAYLAELPDGTITPRYRFIHVLYLDVLYKQVAPTRRSQIHQRIGERGEKVYGDRVGEIAAELAVHFEQGRDWNRAIKYLVQAAENASHRFARYEAITLAEKGIRLMEKVAPSPERDAYERVLRGILQPEAAEISLG